MLFIGGTGTISLASTRLLAERGVELTVLNRGLSGIRLPEGVGELRADVGNREAVAEAVSGLEFDVVVNWLADVPAGGRHRPLPRSRRPVRVQQRGDGVSKALAVLPDRGGRTARVPEWPYAHNKILCEERLRRTHDESGSPATIVRPSYTYGERTLPTALDGTGWTILNRLRRGTPALVPGEGESLWTMTHNTDFARGFVGLLGNEAAIGESFHLTSEEVLTWNQITETIARAAGLEPRIVHVPSDFVAALDPQIGTELLGDRRIRSSSTTRRSNASCPTSKRGCHSLRGSRARSPGSRPTPSGRSSTRETPRSTGSSPRKRPPGAARSRVRNPCRRTTDPQSGQLESRPDKPLES